MKKRKPHIQQILTIVMLWVFSLAITPWSALHHHEEVSVPVTEKHCTHKFHVKTQQETCLVCAAHFEKNYILTSASHITSVEREETVVNHPLVSGSFTELITTSLRGPPVFS